MYLLGKSLEIGIRVANTNTAPYRPLKAASPINYPSTAESCFLEVHFISSIHRLVFEFSGRIACQTNAHGHVDVGHRGRVRY